MLKADSLRPKQQRQSAKALLAQIKAEGYDGGYSRLAAFIRAWCDEGLLIGGIYRRMQVSHLKLCASRAFWLVAYPSPRP